MIVDVIGIRGSGKSTVVKYLKEKCGALTRADRNQFDIPTWREFKNSHYEFTVLFEEIVAEFKNSKDGSALPLRTIKNYRNEFKLYKALDEQLGDRLFVWDKGLIETLTHTVMHSDVNFFLPRVLNQWPMSDLYLHIDTNEVLSFQRSAARTRNVQWSIDTYTTMAYKHKQFCKELQWAGFPIEKLKNWGTVEDLHESCTLLIGSV